MIMEYNTLNTKIIHEFILISRKGLRLGLGGKDFLCKAMPANVEEMMEPENYYFVSTTIIVDSVMAQGVSISR